MAIESVSSASTTVQAPPQNREAQRPEAQAARSEARRAERPEPTPPPQQPEPQAAARPVVNSEGQVTGTRVNTTA